MALHTTPIFGERFSEITDKDLGEALNAVSSYLGDKQLHYFGFKELDQSLSGEHRLREESFLVDNFFRLENDRPAESLPSVLTVGLSESRFCPVMYWEIFHALAVEGEWVELENEDRASAEPVLAVPLLRRDFYRFSMECRQEFRLGRLVVRIYRKVASSYLNARSGEPGWSFGILTAGQSPAAQQIILEILRSCPEPKEIIVCGPLPDGAPSDPRIRQIDLERQEPRGWITRKKNLIADAARYDNLCILHDRFVFPENFFSSMQRYGQTFSVITFPQAYFPDSSRAFMLRYPDYQVLLDAGKYPQRGGGKIFNSDNIFHLKYDDFYPSSFCCGGLYVAKKALWNMVRQDESLFHCEWEDVVFGLACQEKGIPHRVNPFALFESVNPHFMLLTGMHVLGPGGERIRMMPQISASHRRMAEANPEGFKPLLSLTEAEYRGKVAARLAETTVKIGSLPVRGSGSLFRIWAHVYKSALLAPLDKREDVFRLYAVLSETIFNFPNCVLQKWCRDTELELLSACKAGRRSRIGGRIFKILVGAALRLRSVHLLRALRWAAAGWFLTLYPIMEMIEYFILVERDYPRIFRSPHQAAGRETAHFGEPNQASLTAFRDSDLGRATIFCNREGEILPPVL